MSRHSTNTAEQLEPSPVDTDSSLAAQPAIEERDSQIHGRGVYALRRFRAGERIIELVGERISAEESDRRAELLPENGHTFFFWVDDDLVLDCGVNGNSARFINHHCEPNCEAVIEDERVFIDAIRDIAPGEELTFDYNLCWYETDEPEELALYACRCGAAKCRGTMLAPEPTEDESEYAEED
jgi:SET domain-containing protein